MGEDDECACWLVGWQVIMVIREEHKLLFMARKLIHHGLKLVVKETVKLNWGMKGSGSCLVFLESEGEYKKMKDISNG